MTSTPEELLQKFQLDNLPAGRCVFWSHGGSIADADERKIWSVNEELHKSFLEIRAHEAGLHPNDASLAMADGKGSPPDHIYVSLHDALGCHWGTQWLMSTKAADVSFWAEKHFWRDISVRFAQKAAGCISVAVDDGTANTNFRLFEYPAIMANDKISAIRILTGAPVPARVHPYFNRVTKEFNFKASMKDYNKAEKEYGYDNVTMIFPSMLCKNETSIMNKEDWSLMQKQRWFDNTIEKLLTHLEDRPAKESVKISDYRSHYDIADSCTFTAKARFLCETAFCLREAALQQKRLAEGAPGAAKALEQERNRLEKCLALMKAYPEVLYIDEPPTEVEKKHTYHINYISRLDKLVSEFGMMMMRIDDTMSLEDKDRIWGKKEDYDPRHSNPELAGQPRAVEAYTREKIAALRNDLEAFLGPRPEIVLTNNEAEVRKLVAEGYCPVECSINGHSIVDDLVMDHHEDRSHLEPVSLRALRDHAGARAHDPRFVVVGACDADASFAIAALAGQIPVTEATMKLADTIGIMDTTPVGKNILSLPYGEHLAAWTDQNVYTSRKPDGAYAAVSDWVEIASGLEQPDANLQQRIDRSVEKESNRHETALRDLERATTVGQVRLINHSDVFGFSEWHGRRETGGIDRREGWDIPVVVIYNKTTQTMGISCPNKQVAEEVFGKGGLRNIFDKLEGKNGMSFGGRESVGGSPRGQVMTFEDAQKVQQAISDVIDGLDRERGVKPLPALKTLSK